MAEKRRSASKVPTFLDAAVEVLRRTRKPLSTREIASAITEGKLVAFAGKTPEKTLSAALYSEAQKPEGARVIRHFKPGATRAQRDSVRWTAAP
jgi:HB1/ASXL restriction endonuclease-like protein with HTH domain